VRKTSKSVSKGIEGKRSKPFVYIGVLLILVGVLGLVKGRINYGTHEENEIRVGDVRATVQTSRVVVIPPVLCVVVILGGALVGFFGWKKI
jgi:uncharacterized membrane protein YidH (DUF202 family)